METRIIYINSLEETESEVRRMTLVCGGLCDPADHPACGSLLNT